MEEVGSWSRYSTVWISVPCLDTAVLVFLVQISTLARAESKYTSWLLWSQPVLLPTPETGIRGKQSRYWEQAN